ncbi:MAG TPA: hypothetical protein VFX49_10405, partial [Chloroflexota bacterium]|nr:hypothetical protein [Chloroflexota bacterium]
MALATSAAASTSAALPVPSGRSGSLGLVGAPLSPTLVGPEALNDDPIKDMNGIQRAAALLIALGPEASSVIFKHLRDEDVEAITVELFRMRQVSAKVTDAVIEDVYDQLVASDYMETGGLEYAQALITRTFGPERGQQLIDRIAQKVKKGPFDFLREIDPSQLVSFLAPEHPQTVALVLSHLRP